MHMYMYICICTTYAESRGAKLVFPLTIQTALSSLETVVRGFAHRDLC